MSDARAVALVAITDVALAGGAALERAIEAMAAAVPRGSLAVQVRAKQASGAALFALATRVVAVARPCGVSVWCNDRVDVALAAGAEGVHLPEHGLDVATVRRIAPRLAVGVSRHRAGEDESADVVQLGPIWATPSKVGMGEPLGVEALAAARARMSGNRTRATLVAVGGIDGPERASAAIRAGADAVAAIRVLWAAGDPAAAARAIVDAVLATRSPNPNPNPNP